MIPTPPTTTDTAAARMNATIKPKEIVRATRMTVVMLLTLKTDPWWWRSRRVSSTVWTARGMSENSRTSAKTVSTRRAGVKNQATVIGMKMERGVTSPWPIVSTGLSNSPITWKVIPSVRIILSGESSLPKSSW